LVAVLATMVVSLPARGQAAEDRSKFHLTLDSKWMYGPVKGRLQTPSGGQPGTTDGDRPTLSELGIDIASILDTEIRPGIGDHEMYIGGQWVRFEEEATLDQDLTSQGRFFPAGSRVESDVKFDWYRLGYRYRVQKGDEAGIEFPVEIHSRFGVALLDFGYELDGPGSTRVDRHYRKPALQMGVDMEWHATKKFSVAGEFTWTLPFKSMPLIITTNLTGKFKLLEKDGRELNAYIGAGYQKISFHDSQQVRNDINADFGPLLIVGLELRL
jgi:hypothetical protein